MKFTVYQTCIKSIGFGKVLPEAIYLHVSGLNHVDEELHKFVLKIASALNIAQDQWNIIKFAKRDFRLSYLHYPDFQEYPYPSLQTSHTVDLAQRTRRTASYADSENPPILHRRELFLHPDDPNIPAFRRFTFEGQQLGLYEKSKLIGTREGWHRAIRRTGYFLDEAGRLLPSPPATESTPITEVEKVQRHKTAISRDNLSVPMLALAKAGYLNGKYSILDYGCGKGDDLRELEARDIDCIGWDPAYRPDVEVEPCDVVNLGYVINVIEDIEEREQTLVRAYSLTNTILAVSAMLGNDAITSRFRPYKDGVITKANTFQKYYFQAELRGFIERSLKEEAVAAGPGLFLVFKDKKAQQFYLSERQRTQIVWQQISRRTPPTKTRTISKSKIEKNIDLLKDFWQCCLDRGRIAVAEEFEFSDALCQLFGSHNKALAICREQFDEADLVVAERTRINDLLVYLALEHFGKRKAYSRMLESLRKDIRYHFGQYQIARSQGRELLFSINDGDLILRGVEEAAAQLPASVLTPHHDLVFQSKYLNACPAILRVYIGSALQLYGDLQNIDLIKVHIYSGKVTLMAYDGFEDRPIPMLRERIKIKLAEQDIDFFDYVYGFRPQPLLMKSKLLATDHLDYERQCEFDTTLVRHLGSDIEGGYISAERLDYLLNLHQLKIRDYDIRPVTGK
tara:strand:- start:11639 stop:13681 length:2043 start_codon:yes stop_codon:yes gene_type:complete